MKKTGKKGSLKAHSI